MLASGVLGDAAATRLCAQLLTLDAEGNGPIRLELQNLQAELPASLTRMGVLDVVRAEVQVLFYRIAEATGRDAEDIRTDARRGRVLTVAEAIGYGLIHDRAAKRTS